MNTEYNMTRPQQETHPIQQIPLQATKNGVNGNVGMAAGSNYTTTQSQFYPQGAGVMFNSNIGMESPGWGGGVRPFDFNSNSGSFGQPINNFWQQPQQQQQQHNQWNPSYQSELNPRNVHPTGFNTNLNRWSKSSAVLVMFHGFILINKIIMQFFISPVFESNV